MKNQTPKDAKRSKLLVRTYEQKLEILYDGDI